MYQQTALLYDIVNAVYTKMYFLWKLWMRTVEQVVYVRQQTVQHTPVKLKTLIFNSKKLCEYICGDWDGWHEGATDGVWLENCTQSWMEVLCLEKKMLSHMYIRCNFGNITKNKDDTEPSI